MGYEEGGQLTEAVRRHPYSVVLFDEVEKAHPDVFNVMLQILDDGRLTDGHGRTVDFKNTVVIMTSNIGSQFILNYSGRGDDSGYDAMKREVLDVLRREFRPEFLNRVDDIVVFHGLTRDDLREIVEIQLGHLRERLDERHIGLELTRKAKDHFADTGYDPAYGARAAQAADPEGAGDRAGPKAPGRRGQGPLPRGGGPRRRRPDGVGVGGGGGRGIVAGKIFLKRSVHYR